MLRTKLRKVTMLFNFTKNFSDGPIMLTVEKRVRKNILVSIETCNNDNDSLLQNVMLHDHS